MGIDMTYEGIEYAGRVASSSAREQLRAGLGERCHGDDRELRVPAPALPCHVAGGAALQGIQATFAKLRAAGKFTPLTP